jgi:hypothetical protein
MRMYFEQAEERRAKFGFFARATNATSIALVPGTSSSWAVGSERLGIAGWARIGCIWVWLLEEG